MTDSLEYVISISSPNVKTKDWDPSDSESPDYEIDSIYFWITSLEKCGRDI